MLARDDLPINQVLCGDCRDIMNTFSDDCIDLVVTSPPYWGLRDYGIETVRIWGGIPECEHEWEQIVKHRSAGGPQVPQSINPRNVSVVEAQRDTISNICSKCGAWRGSLGLEPHPQLFIDHITEIGQKIKRILKPTGSFWLNLGDTYYGSGGKGGQYEKFSPNKGQPSHFKQNSKTRTNWLQPKQKLMMPARVAIALQNDGWILRNDIIWHKPNHMPSSVKDRLTNAYEHIFLFAKQRRYYFDLDAIRKPYAPTSIDRVRQDLEGQHGGEKERAYVEENIIPAGGDIKQISKILKRLKKNIEMGKGKNPGDVWRISTKPFHGAHFATFPPKLIESIIKAGCPEKGIVLDPFAGSGTVGRVARKLGRKLILIEINPEYCKIAEQRIRGRYKPLPDGVKPFDIKGEIS